MYINIYIGAAFRFRSKLEKEAALRTTRNVDPSATPIIFDVC